MEIAAIINGTVAVVVIGSAVWSLLLLLFLGLGRSAALADEEMERYLEEQYATLDTTEGRQTKAVLAWMEDWRARADDAA